MRVQPKALSAPEAVSGWFWQRRVLGHEDIQPQPQLRLGARDGDQARQRRALLDPPQQQCKRLADRFNHFLQHQRAQAGGSNERTLVARELLQPAARRHRSGNALRELCAQQHLDPVEHSRIGHHLGHHGIHVVKSLTRLAMRIPEAPDCPW